MPAEKTMTLNLSEKEMAGLDALAADKDMSKTAVMRQALRLYQLVSHRIAAAIYASVACSSWCVRAATAKAAARESTTAITIEGFQPCTRARHRAGRHI